MNPACPAVTQASNHSQMTAVALCPSPFRGTQGELRTCIVDIARRHCDIDELPFWQSAHTLRITETNGLGSRTTNARLKIEDLCKICVAIDRLSKVERRRKT